MQNLRRLFTASAVAGGSVLVLSTGVFAAGGDHHSDRSHAAGAAQPASYGSGSRDVPGAAADPSKTDHDNGVGNNCDPGYGRGNQAKMGPDETTSSCRTTSSTGKTSGSGESGENRPPAPPVVTSSSPCGDTVTHHDNESASGSQHESTTAEQHDSGTTTHAGDCSSATGESGESGESGEESGTITLTTENHEIAKVEKLEFGQEESARTLTLVVTTSTGGTETIVVTINQTAPFMVVTVNGTTLSESNLETVLGGGVLAQLLRNLEESGELSLGSGTGEIIVSPTSGGGFTVTLPNGTVLTFTGGTLSTGTTTVAPGASGEVGGVEVTNTSPSGTTGGVAGTTGTTTGASGATMGTGATAPAGATGGVAAATGALGGVSAATSALAGVGGAAANAAQGTPLASTGFPLLAGLLGLLLFGTGFAFRRRR